MADAIDVQSIQEIEGLSRALKRFTAQALHVAQQVHQEAGLAEDWVHNVIRAWSVEASASHEAVVDARRSLDACLADDESHDCSWEWKALSEAQREHQQARRHLETSQAWARQRIRPEVAHVHAETSRLEKRLQEDLQATIQILTRYADELRGTTASRPGAAGATASPASLLFAPSAQSPARPAQANGASPQQLSPIAPPFDTVNAMNLFKSGFRMVPVDAIDDRDNPVTGPQDFSKVPHAEMQAGVQRFITTILPLVQGGADATYFRGADQKRGLSYAQGDLKLYEAFFGDDAVQLDFQGGRYTVTNGRHRIYLARQMGLTHLPARIGALKP